MASRLGRDSIGIELNREYADMAAKRVGKECPMFDAVEIRG